jgi:hypothetical protein
VLGGGTREGFFIRLHPSAPSNAPFFEFLSSPSVALGEDGLPRVPCFSECHAPIGTQESLPSPSAILPQVPDFWHSGKYATLGEFRFSRSDVMRGLSSKFTNTPGVISAMNPLPSFLWVHSYLLQEETRLDRTHKIEAANAILAAGSGSSSTVRRAPPSSPLVPLVPLSLRPRRLVSLHPRTETTTRRNASKRTATNSAIPDLHCQPRQRRRRPPGAPRIPGLAWFMPGRYPRALGAVPTQAR